MALCSIKKLWWEVKILPAFDFYMLSRSKTIPGGRYAWPSILLGNITIYNEGKNEHFAPPTSLRPAAKHINMDAYGVVYIMVGSLTHCDDRIT